MTESNFSVNFKTVVSLLFIFGLYQAVNSNEIEGPKVRTTLGWVQGKYVEALPGKTVNAYYGIPFGQPPIGKLRFMYAKPAEPWEGVLNATSFGPGCPQKILSLLKHLPGFDFIVTENRLSEDCLHLNIWTPSKRKLKSLPVIVIIHGGAFVLGSNSIIMYNGGRMAYNENVIVVNINYRLTSLGFLFLDHPEVQGNAGLVDQILAIKWVKDNIERFGGDPNQITLMGQSAGAISIGFHMVSPMARGLFQRAIMESGSGLINDFVLQDPKTARKRSMELAEYAGCAETKNMTLIVECLKNQDFQTLLDNEPVIDYNPMIFVPTIDGVYLPKEPKLLYEEKSVMKVDLLTGINKNEGTLFMVMFSPASFGKLADDIQATPEDFELLLDQTPQSKNEVLRKAMAFQYIDWRHYGDSRSIINSCDRMLGDFSFTWGMSRTAKTLAKMGSSVYTYFWTYVSPSFGFPKWFGVFHGAELPMVSGLALGKELNTTIEEKNFTRRIMRYWANFARTGNPNTQQPGLDDHENWVKWPRHTQKGNEYLVLSPNSTSVGKRLREKDCVFWEKFMPSLVKATEHAEVEYLIH